jgi:hypothetical protein
MSDAGTVDAGTVTVFDRLTAAGLSHQHIEEHLRSGRVQVDGQTVTDPFRAAPPPAEVVLVVS